MFNFLSFSKKVYQSRLA